MKIYIEQIDFLEILAILRTVERYYRESYSKVKFLESIENIKSDVRTDEDIATMCLP